MTPSASPLPTAFTSTWPTTLDGVHVRGFLTPEVGEALQTALPR